MSDRPPLVTGEVARAIGRAYEGYSLKAYPDPATGGKPWTIGIGHTGLDVYPGLVWTPAQVEAVFRRDIRFAEVAVNAGLAGAACEQCEFDAMVDLAFNIGAGNFQASTLLKLHRYGDHEGAALQFLRWNKAGKPLREMLGLTRRRKTDSLAYSGVPVAEAIRIGQALR